MNGYYSLDKNPYIQKEQVQIQGGTMKEMTMVSVTTNDENVLKVNGFSVWLIIIVSLQNWAHFLK